MPFPLVREHRLTIAYVVLVLVVAVGFFALGQRQANETSNREASQQKLVHDLCVAQQKGREVSNDRTLAIKEFMLAAADTRRQAALQAKAEGDHTTYALNQSAAERYTELATRMVTLPLLADCPN